VPGGSTPGANGPTEKFSQKKRDEGQLDYGWGKGQEPGVKA